MRVALQVGHVWGQSLEAEPDVPNPDDWGWTKSVDNEWKPLWSLLPEAAEACAELIKCSCKLERGCRGRCKCAKANLKCTVRCKCGDDCEQ